MKIVLQACAVAIGAASLATPALAQVPGTYSGTSADGQNVSFVVGTDTNTGNLAVLSENISFSAPCKNSSYVLNQTWGTGYVSDIKNGAVYISATNNYFTFQIFLDFSADGQSATGSVTSISPTLTPVGPRPTHSLFCTSPKQSLTLALQPADTPAKTPALAPGESLNLASPLADAAAESH